MKREEYNACMGQKLRDEQIKKLPEPQPFKFCLVSKLCTGKAKGLEEAKGMCAQARTVHRGKRGEVKASKVKPSEIKPSDAQHSALRVLGKCEITHQHDDGDLTLDCGGYGYVVTTEGRMFKEVRLK